MAAGRTDADLAQVAAIAATIGCPLKPDDLARLNPYRDPADRWRPPPKSEEERAMESKAAWAIMDRFLSGKG